MAEPYLIAHKVHGEPAFDIAVQMECSICLEAYEVTGSMGCDECDSLGYWWIIPTSGHRAYPYWHTSTELLWLDSQLSPHEFSGEPVMQLVPPMPPGLPDHYLTRAAPSASKAPPPAFLKNLLQSKPAPVKLNRRGF